MKYIVSQFAVRNSDAESINSGNASTSLSSTPMPKNPRRIAANDANDMLYQFNASRDYDTSPTLEKITARLLAINSADDVVNPPELGIMEKLMPRVKHGRYILLPTTDRTRGHGTHSLPAIWGPHLAAFMRELP